MSAMSPRGVTVVGGEAGSLRPCSLGIISPKYSSAAKSSYVLNSSASRVIRRIRGVSCLTSATTQGNARRCCLLKGVRRRSAMRTPSRWGHCALVMGAGAAIDDVFAPSLTEVRLSLPRRVAVEVRSPPAELCGERCAESHAFTLHLRKQENNGPLTIGADAHQDPHAGHSVPRSCADLDPRSLQRQRRCDGRRLRRAHCRTRHGNDG